MHGFDQLKIRYSCLPVNIACFMQLANITSWGQSCLKSFNFGSYVCQLNTIPSFAWCSKRPWCTFSEAIHSLKTTAIHNSVGLAIRFDWTKKIKKIFRTSMGQRWMEKCYNAELNGRLKWHDIVQFVKAQRIRWLGHVERMSDERMPKRMLQGR
jgi:hypothetical protein